MKDKQIIRKILIFTILILIIVLLSIIIKCVCFSNNEDIKDTQSKMEVADIKTKKDLLAYLEQSNKDNDITFEVLSEDKEFIRVNKLKKEKNVAIIIFNKKEKTMNEDEIIVGTMTGK